MAGKEKRLIDLDETRNELQKEVWWTDSEKAAIRNFLSRQKRVDAVEVVRCRDCKHYENGGCGMAFGEYEPSPEDFCSCGEKKTEASV